jgi:hypothetical protein
MNDPLHRGKTDARAGEILDVQARKVRTVYRQAMSSGPIILKKAARPALRRSELDRPADGPREFQALPSSQGDPQQPLVAVGNPPDTDSTVRSDGF